MPLARSRSRRSRSHRDRRSRLRRNHSNHGPGSVRRANVQGHRFRGTSWTRVLFPGRNKDEEAQLKTKIRKAKKEVDNAKRIYNENNDDKENERRYLQALETYNALLLEALKESPDNHSG